jgi:tRNA (cmo5U34)-methyltransferase
MLPWQRYSDDRPTVSNATDTLFSDPLRAPGPFRFDADVVSVFPDMIQRSVPGYETVIAMSGLLAARFARPGTNVYDLGCSLGATTLSMRHRLEGRNCRIIGVDNSPAMISRCRELVQADESATPVELVEADIGAIALANASMVVLNYTLQFIPLAQRLDLLRRAAGALQPGGVLVLSEKVLLEDEALNALNVELHHDFKRAHGYSEMEIAGKRDSLENVLLPETLGTHRQRLREAGFRSAEVWFQCFNFASLIALK